MIRATLASGLAVTLAVGFVASPAYSAQSETPAKSKKSRASDRGHENYNLDKRAGNSKIAAQRTGKGSVQGAAGLRAKADRWNPNRQVRLVTSYSVDGTIAGFKGLKVRTVKARDVDDVIAQVEADKTAVAVEEDKPVQAIEASSQSTPGGGQYSQWALTKLQAGQLWQQSTGQGVKVAVLDTGVEANHPDLSGQVLAGKDFMNDGYAANQDPHGHGTHVAGIVAASMNSIGVTGLAPNAKIIPIRVLGADGSGTMSGVANGIYEAADRGADIINMSLGGTGTSSPVVQMAVNYARNKGVSVMAAMGNNGGYVFSIPAVLPGVVGVGSTTNSDGWSNFSNYNEFADVSAPGSSINSTYKNAGYAGMSGTSMATPYAAASLAVSLQAARSVNGSATGLGVEQVLLNTAVDLGASGYDHYFGYGRVNPLAAVTLLTAGAEDEPEPPGSEDPTPEPSPEPQPSPSPTPPTSPAPTKPAPKPVKSKVKVTVKINRVRAKLRSVAFRANSVTTVKIKLLKSVRGKWRTQRTLSLGKNRQVNLRLAVGKYRLTRNATATYYQLNQAFRVR